MSLSTMLNNALQHICFSKGISACIPPPGFAPPASSHVTYTRLDELFELMTTTGEDMAQFKEVISKQDREEFLMTVSLLTSDSDFFMAVVRNKYGSRRVQELMGMSDDVDAFFYAVILRRFYDIMTDKYASYVANQAMVVFDNVKRNALYEHVLHYALGLACDRNGHVSLDRVIADVDDLSYKNRILDVVTHNALYLSKDLSGNYVVQHVLALCDSRCTNNVMVSVRGHCVDMAFKKLGSYIVEKLVEDEETMDEVVMELLECDRHKLMKLATSKFGAFVVVRALEVTKETNKVDMFCGLVQKLLPVSHLLRRSDHGIKVATILRRCYVTTRCSN